MIQNSKLYKKISCPKHPKATDRGFIHEHIFIAEKALGKLLPPKAEIHHYADHNDNTKIIICQDREYHCLLHIRTQALKTCGHANWRKCEYCKQYDKPENLYIKKRKDRGWHIHHKQCRYDYIHGKRLWS
jgi:hypothetical protein